MSDEHGANDDWRPIETAPPGVYDAFVTGVYDARRFYLVATHLSGRWEERARGLYDLTHWKPIKPPRRKTTEPFTITEVEIPEEGTGL